MLAITYLSAITIIIHKIGCQGREHFALSTRFPILFLPLHILLDSNFVVHQLKNYNDSGSCVTTLPSSRSENHFKSIARNKNSIISVSASRIVHKVASTFTMTQNPTVRTNFWLQRIISYKHQSHKLLFICVLCIPILTVLCRNVLEYFLSFPFFYFFFHHAQEIQYKVRMEKLTIRISSLYYIIGENTFVLQTTRIDHTQTEKKD